MSSPTPGDKPDATTISTTRPASGFLALAGAVFVVLLAAGIGYVVGRGDSSGETPVPVTGQPIDTPLPTTGVATTVDSSRPCVDVVRDANLVPSCGLMLGTTDRQVDSLDLATQERILGRAFSMVRIYKVGPGETFFNANEQRLADEGRVLVYSWKVINEPGAWARVAAGEFDAELRRAANEIVASGHVAMFSLHHEPEDNVPASGSNADYVSMMRHAHEVMEPIGGDSLVWFINYRGHSFGSYDQVNAMYPGDDVIDWISWNPYNWFGCQGDAAWTDFASQARPFYEWAQTNHPTKPLMIGETATNEDPDDPDRKARWIADMGTALVNEYPAVKAVLWFHQSAASNFCDRRWDSSAQSAAAFTEFATSSDFFS